jgi:hypothetical protein
VYVVEGDNNNTFWTKLDAVWPHDDSKGYNLELIAYPTNGRLVVREAQGARGYLKMPPPRGGIFVGRSFAHKLRHDKRIRDSCDPPGRGIASC